MRLTALQTKAICETAQACFGLDVRVWLFGARVDDFAKGGDIDLYIESQMDNAADLITAKLLFLRDLHKKIGQQKVDVVFKRPNSTLDLPVYRITKQTGVQLQ